MGVICGYDYSKILSFSCNLVSLNILMIPALKHLLLRGFIAFGTPCIEIMMLEKHFLVVVKGKLALDAPILLEAIGPFLLATAVWNPCSSQHVAISTLVQVQVPFMLLDVIYLHHIYSTETVT